MPTNHHPDYTLFQDRNLQTTAFQPKPARFSTEVEGEAMEIFLRGFLVACLLAALALCNLRGSVDHGSQRSLPDTGSAVALNKPGVAPASAPTVKVL